jgi:CubicO group peptidase (beta-lactamase class C family)
MHAAFESAWRFAQDHETPWSREVGPQWGIHLLDPPPWNRLLGPVHGRGPVSGTILLDGIKVSAWGEPERADLTFSVAKAYLALLAGVAHDQGLLPDVDEPVGKRVRGIGFDSGRNAEVSWAHLLTQTSEWSGSCFGISDQVDHYRTLQFQTRKPSGQKGDPRPLQAPGSYWEYNDVRINQLSLALMHLFGRPLPEIFAQTVMTPIGASSNWRWVGYDNSWLDLHGRRVQSVPGGSHWGGGMSIGSADQALVGQLLLNNGAWNGRQLISKAWIERMRTPSKLAPFYGYLLWLNQGQQVFPSLPASSYFAFGAGGNFTWVEPQRRLVVVVRWINPVHADAFFKQVLQVVDQAGG